MRASRADSPSSEPGDLDHPGTERSPAHDRPGVVVRIDAIGDVRDEQVRELLDRHPMTPVSRAVVPVVVEPGGRDDMDAGAARDPASIAAFRPASQGMASTTERSPSPTASATSIAIASTSAEIELRFELDRRPPSMTRCSWAVGHAEPSGAMSPSTVRMNVIAVDRQRRVGERQDRAVGAQSIAERA